MSFINALRNFLNPTKRANIFRPNFKESSILIYSFNKKEVVDEFNVTSDIEYGGNSISKVQFISQLKDNKIQNNKKNDENNEEYINFLRFSGRTDSTPIPKANKSGFCALRSPFFSPPIDLNEYKGLEFKVRTCGRGFIFSLGVETFLPDCFYQGLLLLPPHEWYTVQIPFSSLLMTAFGRPTEIQKKLDIINIESIGFNISDNQSGPFYLDIKGCKAITHITAWKKYLPSEGYIQDFSNIQIENKKEVYKK